MSVARWTAGIIGLGAMGRRHARVLSRLPDRFELVGGHDIRGGVAGEIGIAPLRSEAEAIARCRLLVVATPIESHHDVAWRALEAGCAVLVEKPLCPTAVEARALAEHPNAGERLFVGHSERHNPVVRALAAMLCDDEVSEVDLRRVGPSSAGRHGALLNWGVHDLDLASYLCGGPLVLEAASAPSSRGEDGMLGAEQRADVVVRAPSGAVARIHLDAGAPQRERSIVVKTRRGLVYKGDLLVHRLTRVDTRSARSDEASPIGLTDEEPLRAQALAIADVLAGAARSDAATGRDGALAVALAEEAARRALPERGARDIDGRAWRAAVAQSTSSNPDDPPRLPPA